MVSSLLARCIIVTIGTLYPGYRSYKSLINSDLREVVTCLRYWIVFSIFIACETVTDIFLSWFPFYYWIKIAIVFWMNTPAGSTFLYKRFIHPKLKEHEQDIDELLEKTKQKGYSTLMDLTHKGLRIASNAVFNTAAFSQQCLGDHLKRSLSTSDINSSTQKKEISRPPATLHEEDEDEELNEIEDFRKGRKDDRKNPPKTSNGSNRRVRSQQQDYVDEISSNQSDGPRVETRQQQRTAQKKLNSTPYSTSESSHIGTISKRQVAKAMAKKNVSKPTASADDDVDYIHELNVENE